MADRAPSYSSSLILEELTGQGGQPGRVLTLLGSGLPFMGAEWGMKVAIETTWYPGNPNQGTQQVLGPQELPSRWSGEWRRTMLTRTPATYVHSGVGPGSLLVRPLDLVDAFESIARSGQRLRVTWAVTADDDSPDRSGKIVREGRMGELKFKPSRVTDIEWEIEFHWVSRGGAVAPVVSSTRSPTVASNSAAYQNKVNALVAACQAAALNSGTPSRLTIGQLESVASGPTRLVNSLARQAQEAQSTAGQLVQLATTIGTQPAQVQNRAIDLAANSTAQVANFYDQLSEIPYEHMSNKSRVRDVLRSSVSLAQMSDLALAAANAAWLYAAQLRSLAQPQLNSSSTDPRRLGDPNDQLQVYITHQGDTPQLVSQRFYGTPDHAVDILRSNALAWHTPSFSAGRILIIPVLAQLDPTQSV